jgi:hypothetical protein
LIESEAAVDNAIGVGDSGCPVPEHAAPYDEDDGRNAKYPNDEVQAEAKGGMEGAAFAEDKVEKNGNGIIEKGKKDLSQC